MTTLLLLLALSGVEGLQADSAAQAAALLQPLEKAELTFYKIDPASEGAVAPGRRKLHEWAILQTKVLKDADAASVRSALADKSLYGDLGAKCFTPGLAFRFKGDGEPVDLVICLACSWIYVYRGETRLHSWAISKDGVARLKTIYLAHADPEAKK